MAKEQDQSMEEILQSIKRIIAEEGEAPGGSDVLELTDLVQEDGSVSKAKSSAGPEIVTGSPIPAADAPAVTTGSPLIETMSIDEIIAAPVMHEFEPTPPAPRPAPKAETPPPPPPKPPEPAMPAQPATDSLVSDQTLSASAAALSALREVPQAAPTVPTPSPVFRSGNTVEDLVLEVLRPMLKQWLDANLTGIVERLVEREIRKLTR